MEIDKNKSVTIHVGSTAIKIKSNSEGYVSTFPSVSIFPFLKSELTEYDFDYRRNRYFAKYKYFFYDKYTEILSMPRHILKYLKNYLIKNGLNVILINDESYECDKVEFKLSGEFKDRDYQVPMIDYLVNNDSTMRALEMQTGSGKTYSSTKAIFRLSLRTVIIVPAFLIDQWYKSLFDILDINKSDVFILKGTKSILQAYMFEEEKPKIFLASISTLFSYITISIKDSELPSLDEIFKKLKIGVKIVDECHMRFNANTIVDLLLNVKHNLYLSATYMRSNRKSDLIFKKVFPPNVRFNKGEYDKYVDIYEVSYNIGYIPEKAVSTKRGYAQMRYEQYLLKNIKKFDTLMTEIFKPIIVEYFLKIKNTNQKLLIIVATREFASYINDFIISQEDFSNLKSNVFLAEHDESILDDSDIIISTTGSAGTGRDISDLRTLILFTSFASETQTLQTIGRLRKLKNNDTPVMVYLYNRKISHHLRHRDKRSIIYSDIAKEYFHVDL